MTKHTPQDKSLIQKARDLIIARHSNLSSVGSALITKSGKIFTGVNVESIHSSPCSMCAEYPAIGQMYASGEQTIATIVAVMTNGTILPPCGRCREMIRQFGNPWILLNNGKMKIADLIPEWDWKESK